MTEWQVFGVLITIMTFIGSAYVMFYKPIHELALQIAKSNANIESMMEKDELKNKRLNSHSERIDEISKIVIRLDTDVKYIKDRVNI